MGNDTAERTGADSIDQIAIEDLPSRAWDFIIVGAGPAGSVAAMELSRMGHSVMLVDRHWFPRTKICGDCLTPGAMRILQRLELYDVARKEGFHCSSMSIFSPAHIRIDVPGDYLTVRREILDQLLVRKALDMGVTFVRATAEDLEERAGQKVRVRFREGDAGHVARCCLLATGGGLSLARKAGIMTHSVASGAAVRCYVRSKLPLDRLVVACEPSVLPGYAWIFPVGTNLFNVGCGRFMYGHGESHINLHRIFRTFLEEFPLAREMMAQGKVETPLKGAVLRSGWQQAGPIAHGPCLGLGEMIGTTSPYTGEGIGKAMQSGILAARLGHRCLLTGDMSTLQRYPTYLRQLGGLRYEGFKRTRKWFRRPWLVDFLARRINHSPYLYDAFASILQEKSDPAQVFSCRGVWRSLWR